MTLPECGKRNDLSIRLVRNDIFGKFADGFLERMRRQLGDALTEKASDDRKGDCLTFTGDFMDPARSRGMLDELSGLREILDEAKLFFQIILELKTTYNVDRFETTSAYLKRDIVAGLALLGLPVEFIFTPVSTSPVWIDESHADLIEEGLRTTEGPFDPGERRFLYSLIVRGKSLNPEMITEILGTPPDSAHKAGDEDRRGNIYELGMWRRDFEEANELPLANRKLCTLILEKEHALQTLDESYGIEISLGVFHDTLQSLLVPFTVPCRTLSLTARIHGELNIDVYPPFRLFGRKNQEPRSPVS